jgi:hypothetical protein
MTSAYIQTSTTGRLKPLAALLATMATLGSPATVPVNAADPSSKGRALAEKYCSACHLFPEPDLLTKTAWTHHILPEMAKWLGLERVDFEGMSDGKLLEDAKIYPGSPLLPEPDWFAIWDYYRDAAPSRLLPQPAKPVAAPTLRQFKTHVFNPMSGVPMISMTRIRSPGRLQVADSFASMVFTLDKSGTVTAKERFGSPLVSIAQGQRRSYLTLIGRLFPSDVQEGAVLAWTDSPERGAPRPLLDHLRRPTDTIAADVNQDGREDLIVCQFGHRLGQFSWFENKGDNEYEEHVLLDRPGAIAAKAIDLTRDGRPDLLVLTGQAREALILFINEGQGRFTLQPLIEKPPSWGFAAFELVDMNRDGFVDVLTVNGDNGDFALPLKPYHGIRLYLNDGKNQFREVFFYPMHGAYKALARDFDGDGDADIAAIAFYPDFASATPEGFVYLENLGDLRFSASTCAEALSGRWMTMDAGDLDGDGDEDLALGSFVKGPTTVPIPAARREQWRTNGAAILYLENLRR